MIRADQFEELSDKEFSSLFIKIHEKMLDDPINNFVEAELFCDTILTPGQRVLFKLVMNYPLDNVTKFDCIEEVEDESEDIDFSLKDCLMTEVELYEYFTGKPYDVDNVDRIRDVTLIVGRRGGKCLVEGTLVKTPMGSVPIEEIKPGDLVYGYNKDGSVSLTNVVQVHDQGIKDVIDLVNNKEVIATCTKEHRWMTENCKTGKKELKSVKNFNSLTTLIKKDIKIPGGIYSVPDAYVLGALLGDGCCSVKNGSVCISSNDKPIIDKIKELADIEITKNKSNYTWTLKGFKKSHLYNSWISGKKAHEKICDISIIRTWDRYSQLEFLAGLIDTDGSIVCTKNTLNFEIGMQAKTVIETVQQLFIDLFQININITLDHRGKNGPLYQLKYKNNKFVNVLKELSNHIVCDRKKFKDQYIDLKCNNSNKTRVGVNIKNKRKAHCYDLSLENETHLYMLANGTVTHNTMCASILALWNAIKKNWKPMLGRKKTATVLVMSHTKEFSDEIIEEVRAIIEDSPVLSRLINTKAKNTQSTINLKIPFLEDGKLVYSYVRIRTSAASSKSSRGSACPCIIADEIAFWGSDPNSKETDKEIVRAVKPSMLQFEDDAMWIELSTPNIKEGVLFDKYDKRETLTNRQVVLKAPSWVFNNRYRAEDYIDFWLEDDENFDREFRANFTDSLGSFFSPESIDLAVMNGIKVIPPAEKSEKVKYICAIDSAFKGDVFTVNVIGVHENRTKQYAVLGFKGTRKFPVKANDVAKAIRELAKQYGFERVYGDQFSFQPLREIFATYNLTLIEKTFTQPFKQKIYKNLKYALEGQQLDLLDHAPTKKELKAIQVEISSTGSVRIMHPPGGHDDFSDSLAIACYMAKEESGQLESDLSMTNVTKDYGIQVDVNGIAFKAPSAEMLADHIGYQVTDNSSEYVTHPESGKLVHYTMLEDPDEEEVGPGFAF